MVSDSSSLPHHQPSLPISIERRRKRHRQIAGLMLSIAIGTAILGWSLFGSSIFSAVNIREQPPSLVIVAYAILLLSSTLLVLGLWYALLSQVQGLARMVQAEELENSEPDLSPQSLCPKCARPHDRSDRFCRHCGLALASKLPQPEDADRGADR